MAHIIGYFNKMSVLPDNNERFKSRFKMKALLEIYMMMIRRELAKKSHARQDINKIKKNIHEMTMRLSDHSEKCLDLIEKYSLNVLRDGMTIMVHGYSRCVLRALKSAHDRGIRITVIATES